MAAVLNIVQRKKPYSPLLAPLLTSPLPSPLLSSSPLLPAPVIPAAAARPYTVALLHSVRASAAAAGAGAGAGKGAGAGGTLARRRC
eukprot:24138-Hanusia_phi.AAC.1